MIGQMKKVLILCRRESRSDYDRKDAFSDAIQNIVAANDYTIADFEDLLFTYDNERLAVIDTASSRDVADFDVIFMIGWFKTSLLGDTAKAVAHYATQRGVKVINEEAYLTRSLSKLSQLVIAHDHHFRITPFVFSLDPSLLKQAVNEHRSLLGESFIVKTVNGNKGNDNYLVTHDQVNDVITAGINDEKNFIAQWFVPNDGDLRIITMGGHVHLVLHRTAQEGTHLNNTSKGGEAILREVDELPQTLRQASIELSNALCKQVAGIDVVQHRETGDYYFLEINNMPQLATGSFVLEKIKALDSYFASI